ncbi:hypothetical protein FB561_1894 [Kribbella amoyensis]|uniref:Uncharacterized protein n=1 Tax=Kribbella amoyensis TaxID=996641 RepID=A0A561BPS3_9ACTN|nr:hypothetical protein FB561_1894 [Kribbella amoyensis]
MGGLRPFHSASRIAGSVCRGRNVVRGGGVAGWRLGSGGDEADGPPGLTRTGGGFDVSAVRGRGPQLPVRPLISS